MQGPAPSGYEQWRMEGTNPYVRRYYPNDFTSYINTSGNPEYHRVDSVAAINDTTVGPDMDVPKGAIFVNDGNGDEFIVGTDGGFHKVPWPDMNSCLGITPERIIHMPARVVGALPQGEQMNCTYSNRIVTIDGKAWYVDQTGIKHVINEPSIRDCIAVRRNAGPNTYASTHVLDTYPQGAEAYCPYETSPGLNFIETSDGTIFLVGVDPDGTAWKRHVGRGCVTDPETTSLRNYRFWHVPAGEDGGRWLHQDFFGDFGSQCDALPK